MESTRQVMVYTRASSKIVLKKEEVSKLGQMVRRILECGKQANHMVEVSTMTHSQG